MTKRLRVIFSIVINVFILLCNIHCLYTFMWGPGDEFIGLIGTTCFRYFTIDSNWLCAISGMILVYFEVRYLINQKDIPGFAYLLKFIGIIGTTVTIVTVLTILGSIYGYVAMFSSSSFYLHGVCPILALVSIFVFEYEIPYNHKLRYLGIIPMAIYGIIYLLCVLVFKIWPDFYGLNMVMPWYVSAIVMYGGTYGIVEGLHALLRLKNRKVKNNGTI